MRGPYPSDLSDAEWAILAPLLPAPAACGRPRKWPERLITDAVFEDGRVQRRGEEARGLGGDPTGGMWRA